MLSATVPIAMNPDASNAARRNTSSFAGPAKSIKTECGKHVTKVQVPFGVNDLKNSVGRLAHSRDQARVGQGRANCTCLCGTSRIRLAVLLDCRIAEIESVTSTEIPKVH